MGVSFLSCAENDGILLIEHDRASIVNVHVLYSFIGRTIQNEGTKKKLMKTCVMAYNF